MKKKAKKKVVKKTAKKKKTTTKPAKRNPLVRLSPEARLHHKIQAVMATVPIIECTGEEKIEDENGKQIDTYNYTEAPEVFRIYTEQMVRVGLTFTPVHIESRLDSRAYQVIVTYRLTDVDTGFYIDIVGAGLGCNGVWSINSAQTVARKQALLNAFGASYPQPETAKKKVRKAVKMFDPLEKMDFSPEGVRKQMEQFYDENVGKPKK